ncbi:MAG: cytochrome c-type biogenesis protein [Oleiphilaceae bacterium]|nr:cytochrome c-type biogenesis protein [Oleiphilaceae bacterium]
MRRILMGCLLMLLALPALSQLQTNELSDPEKQRRYQELTRELRCPLCQNESIAESDAPIANDMRRDVHRRLEAGQSDEEIVQALVARFGEFVRYSPRVTPATWALWFGPFVLVLVGLLVVVLMGLRGRRSQQAPAALDDGERARVQRLLRENDRNQ